MLKIMECLGSLSRTTKTNKVKKEVMYKCICSCGNELVLPKYKINTSTTQCKRCGHTQRITNQLTTISKNIIDIFNIKHNYKYDYTKFIYTNDKTKSIIVCKTHGEFLQTPHAHKAGQGCPTCAVDIRSIKLRMFNTHRPAYVYFVYFKHLNLYKLGVTINIKHRFRGEPIKPDILWLKQYSSEQQAYFIESKLLKLYASHINNNTNFKPLKRKGNFELISTNILESLLMSVETIENSNELNSFELVE